MRCAILAITAAARLDCSITRIETGKRPYQRVQESLQELLGSNFSYQIKPWEGGDRIRPKRMNTVFVDLFVLRPYHSLNDLKSVIGIKTNGQPQSTEYITNIISKIQTSANKASIPFNHYSYGKRPQPLPQQSSSSSTRKTDLPLWPCWHFATRKAIERNSFLIF